MGQHRNIEGVSRTNLIAISNPDLIRVVEGFNPRSGNLGDLTELKASIEELGVQIPILIRAARDEEAGTEFNLIDGERRLSAVRELHAEGKTDIRLPAKKFTGTEQEAEVLMAVANIQRESFDPVEEAEVVKRFVDYGWTDKEISKRLGKSLGWVQQKKRLQSAAPEVKEAVKNGMPQGAAADLASLPEEQQAEKLKAAQKKVKGKKKTKKNKELRKAAAEAAGKILRPGKKDARRLIEKLSTDPEFETAFEVADVITAIRYGVGDISEEEFLSALLAD